MGASTIQFANVRDAPTTGPATVLARPVSPLRLSNVEMCDVDETKMQPTFIGYTGPTASARDWVGLADDTDGYRREHVPGHLIAFDDDDDWC